jgi:hypothetical protein
MRWLQRSSQQLKASSQSLHMGKAYAAPHLLALLEYKQPCLAIVLRGKVLLLRDGGGRQGRNKQSSVEVVQTVGYAATKIAGRWLRAVTLVLLSHCTVSGRLFVYLTISRSLSNDADLLSATGNLSVAQDSTSYVVAVLRQTLRNSGQY